MPGRRVAESRFESVDEQPRLDVDVFRRRRDRILRQEGLVKDGKTGASSPAARCWPKVKVGP